MVKYSRRILLHIRLSFTQFQPFSYLNAVDSNTGKATVIPNPANAELIKRAFHEYATGAYSLSELARKSIEWGLRSNNGNELGTQQLHHMMLNPFYYGMMKVKGELHPHKYEPLISKAVFDICHDVRTKRGRKQAVKESKHPFLFRGLIKCAVSDRAVSCDLKKGKYVYLICRDPEAPHRKLWVKESVILKQVEEAFASIQVPSALLPDLIGHINKLHEEEKQFSHDSINALNAEMEQVNSQLDRLTDLLINETINKETFDRKHSQLQTRRKEIAALQDEHQEGNEGFTIAIKKLISLASLAPEILKSSKTEVKRALMAFVFSNLEMNGQKLRFALHPPLSDFQNVGDFKGWLGR